MRIEKKVLSFIDLWIIGFAIIQFNGLLSPIDNLIYLVCGVVWIFFAGFEDRYSFTNAISTRENVLLIIFLVCFLFNSILKNTFSTVVAGSLAQLLMYFQFSMCLYYVQKRTKRNQRLIKIILFIVVIYLILAIKYYSSNPELARYLVANPDKIIRGIGGNAYGFCVVANVISLFYFNILIRKNNCLSKWTKLFGICFIVLSILLTINVDSATTIFIYVLCFVLSIINNILEDRKTDIITGRETVIRILVYVMAFVGVFLLRYFISDILIMVADIGVGGAFFNDRLLKVASSITGSGVTGLGGSFAERLRLANNSFNSFLRNPLFGASFFEDVSDYSIIGGHSEFFDVLGKYGLIGGGSLILFIVFALKKLYTKEFSPIIVYFVFMSIMNPMHYPQAFFALFFIVPVMITINKNNQNSVGRKYEC